MEQFVPFIGLTVAHDYYQTAAAGHFSLSPTAQTEQLMRRRGILFRPQADGWTWLMREECAGFDKSDVLELSMQATDADFLRVTKLDGYCPQRFYRLALRSRQDVNAAALWSPTDEKKWMPELCRIVVKPTAALLKKAKLGTPMKYTLRFQTPAFRWEYLFVDRNENNDAGRNFLLEEAKGRLTFEKTERLKNSPYGEHVWRTVSTATVSAREHPDYLLTLLEVLQEVPPKKRTVSRFIPCPRSGQYLTDEPDTIRQVCYI